MGTGARASKTLPSWDEGWTVQKVEWLVGERNFGVEMFSDEPVSGTAPCSGSDCSRAHGSMGQGGGGRWEKQGLGSLCSHPPLVSTDKHGADLELPKAHYLGNST